MNEIRCATIDEMPLEAQRAFFVIVASATNLGTSRATLVSMMDYAGLTRPQEMYGHLDRLKHAGFIVRYDRGRPCRFQLAADWEFHRAAAQRFISEHRERVDRLSAMRQVQRAEIAEAIRGEGAALPHCTIVDLEQIPTASTYKKWRFTLRMEHLTIRNCVYVETSKPFVAGPTKKDRQTANGYTDIVRIEPTLSAHLCLEIRAHLSQTLTGDVAAR